MINVSKAYLLLADGTVFTGTGFGARGTRVAELVFTIYGQRCEPIFILMCGQSRAF